MSYDDGRAALHLEAPPKVPRTEYSATEHWELVSAVTGLPVSSHSPEKLKAEARRTFYKKWDYGLVWNTLIGGDELRARRSRMGHAKYADGGTDFDADVRAAFSEPEEAYAFDPVEVYGTRPRAELVERFERDYHAQLDDYGDAIRMTGVYVTCVSGLIEMLGWDMLLLAAGADPARFGALVLRYVEWVEQYFLALAEADVPVVMIHDDIVWTSGPFLHPDWYREFVFPSYRRLFTPLVESGKLVLFTSDGDYTVFVEDIAPFVHGFVMEPCTDMATVAERFGRTHVLVGNADTRVLLSGRRDDIRREVERCMSVGKRCPGYFMAVGNHIPANTPVESAIYYDEVYKELAVR